tara:strand:- start:374 stop:901 length:528 start_codon:yes stop_codon:yes gene_type:complete
MKNSIFLAFALIMLNSCSEPTVEEKISSAIEKQENISVSEVKVGDTVLVKTLNARIVVLDSTLLALTQSLKKMKASKEASIIGLDEAKRNLSKVSHPALTFGFNDVINRQKKNIESFTNLINQNNTVTETINQERQKIQNKLKHAGKIIAYIKISAKVDQSVKEYLLSPDLKIIK